MSINETTGLRAHPKWACPNLAELLFPHVTDSVTWCRLAQVSKRFNKVAKEKLIKRIGDGPYINGYTEWTEMPSNGRKHGIYLECFCVDSISYKHTYKDGQQHGTSYSWFDGGVKHYIRNFKNGNLCGENIEWNRDGTIYFEKRN